MRTRSILLGACLWLLCATPAGADDAPAPAPATAPGPCKPAVTDAAVARIQARYDTIRDLSADFVQTSESVVLSGLSLADAEATRGTVVFAKPGKMRWHYTAPDESYVISDGKTLWIYDVAAAQVSKLAVDGAYLTGAALQFLLGEGRLADSFHVTGRRCTEREIELELVPRLPASYERLGLTADRKTDLVVDTTITDLFGNRTRIRFDAMVLDKDPEPAVFQFEPPAGVEVVDVTSGF